MDTSFNIVHFMETNPIARLTDTYNNKLLQKIKESFTEEQQQLFISSFYCYLNYHPRNDFVVDLDNVWQWLGFAQKQKAKILLERHFTLDIDYKILLSHMSEQVERLHGGHNKETIRLNIRTFKLFCIKAGTKKAHEIHEYFVKLEETLQEVIQEESEEMKQQLQAASQRVEAVERNIEVDRHSIIFQAHDKKRLVYIMKLQTQPDGKFVIKIGETMDIKARCQAIAALYGGIRPCIMDVFPCEYNYEFEQFLHKNPVVQRYRYVGPINEKYTSRETYLMTNMKSYEKIKRVIQHNLYKYHGEDKDKLKWQMCLKMAEMYGDDKDRFEHMVHKIMEGSSCEARTLVGEEPETTSEHPRDPLAEEKDEDDVSELPHTVPISRSNSYGPKIQIYSPDDLRTVLNVFDGITEATREIDGASYTHIKYASKRNIVYKQFRWNLIPRNDPTPFSCKPLSTTVDSYAKRTGFVARLNHDKTRVTNVFALQKDAADDSGMHKSVICTSIKYGSICGEHYWVYWDDLDKTLREPFLLENELPQKPVKAKGVIVQQIDPITNSVARTFPSISDATKEMKVSTNTIKMSSMNDTIHGGWKWKIL